MSTEELIPQIAAIWSRILGVASVDARDNFFDLGGHSLLAVQAHRDIRNALGVTKLAITDIFRHPVLADLAAAISVKTGGGAPPARPAPAAPSGAPAGDPAASGGNARADAMARRREMRARRDRSAG